MRNSFTMISVRTIVIVGGGAAGFFAAANLLERLTSCKILILEKSNKLLAKVRISGGGRCNVTHDCEEISELIRNYPRGGRQLKKVFSQFAVRETKQWFEQRGVKLKKEADGRIFPQSDTSQTIIDCLLHFCKDPRVEVHTHCEVFSIRKTGNDFFLETSNGQVRCDSVLVAAGGFPKPSGYEFLKWTGHRISNPIPSLFTLNLTNRDIVKFMGVSVKNAEVKVAGTHVQYKGPVLITHWGLSGPAVLKLSAFAAELFFEKKYNADIVVNWLGDFSEQQVRELLDDLRRQRGSALPTNTNIFHLPERLWNYFLLVAGVEANKNWSEQSGKSFHRLVSKLCSDVYRMEGKTTFKEEFVTCGGVELSEVDMNTMQSKLVQGLFFAGEMLNIDGITGGFNFQAAWSTSYVSAKNICNYSNQL